MTQERLEELVEKGLLRPITDVVAPEWIAPEEGDRRAKSTHGLCPELRGIP
jgi:hypothetical protein